MIPQDFREWLSRQPFRPFRIHVLELVEVRHPEWALLKAGSVDLHFPKPDHPLPLPDHWVTIDLMAISRLEPLPAAPSSSGNGA